YSGDQVFKGGPYSGEAIGLYAADKQRSSWFLHEYPSNGIAQDSAMPTLRVVTYDGHLTFLDSNRGSWWLPAVYPDTPYFYATPPRGAFEYNKIIDPQTPIVAPVAWHPGTTNNPDPDIHFDAPLYSVSRTFGTNGRTQNIQLNVEDVGAS